MSEERRIVTVSLKADDLAAIEREAAAAGYTLADWCEVAVLMWGVMAREGKREMAKSLKAGKRFSYLGRNVTIYGAPPEGSLWAEPSDPPAYLTPYMASETA